MVLSATSTLTLRDGLEMPVFGLGTWLASGDLCYDAVRYALNECGTILIDTADMYGNEVDVGRAINESGIEREKIFVVTKLKSSNHGYEATKKALRESLDRLQLDYVNLFLIHTPNGKKIVETWKAVTELKQEGLAKSIGVSNFGIKQLEELLATGLEAPEINQIEGHVFLPQEDVSLFCRARNIQMMGYCPFARQKCKGNKTLLAIGAKYGKSESQVMLRWSVQRGFVTIPKSTTPSHIKENSEIFDFELNEEDLERIAKENNGFKASSSVNHQDLPWDEVK